MGQSAIGPGGCDWHVGAVDTSHPPSLPDRFGEGGAAQPMGSRGLVWSGRCGLGFPLPTGENSPNFLRALRPWTGVRPSWPQRFQMPASGRHSPRRLLPAQALRPGWPHSKSQVHGQRTTPSIGRESRPGTGPRADPGAQPGAYGHASGVRSRSDSRSWKLSL